jgi:hypothetical protein
MKRKTEFNPAAIKDEVCIVTWPSQCLHRALCSVAGPTKIHLRQINGLLIVGLMSVRADNET